MALLDIHLLGSAPLRARSAEVATVDDPMRQFIDDLFETMDAAEGVGLAANQVGVTQRVAVVGVEDDRFAMINPVITSAEGRIRAEEGCLSIPGIYGEVTRPERIVLEALDRDGKPYRRELEGYVARAVQHEIDHLDGVIFLDHLSLLKRELLLRRWKKDHRGEPLIRKVSAEGGKQR
ncbi:MAG: peptide deformylase [Gemmatimonadetes bacterium]|nr:peptide deformylase [Gemmatimonadota bacterium]